MGLGNIQEKLENEIVTPYESQKYYGNPFHGWLIMLANPTYGGLEFVIEEGEIIRIPFPFKDTLQEYEDAVNTHIRLNG